jgi:acetyl esterase/lipase
MSVVRRRWVFLVGALVLAMAAVGIAFAPSLRNFYGHRAGVVIREDLPYRPGSSHPKQRLDLYLPAEARGAFPLLVFVHGGIWKAQDRRFFQPATGLYGAVGVRLARQGVGVAVVGYRQYPEVGFAEGIDDLATAVAFVQRSAAQWGADPEAVVVAGHSNGGLLVSLLALDPQYLRRVGSDPARLRGFVSIAGTYAPDRILPSLKSEEAAILVKCAGGPAGLATFSPLQHARADAPPMLLVVAHNDFPFLVREHRDMLQALAPAGDRVTAVELPTDDHMSMLLNLGTQRDNLSLPLLTFIHRVIRTPAPNP